MDQRTAFAALRDVRLTPADARRGVELLEEQWRRVASRQDRPLDQPTEEARILFGLMGLVEYIAADADPWGEAPERMLALSPVPLGRPN